MNRVLFFEIPKGIAYQLDQEISEMEQAQIFHASDLFSGFQVLSATARQNEEQSVVIVVTRNDPALINLIHARYPEFYILVWDTKIGNSRKLKNIGAYAAFQTTRFGNVKLLREVLQLLETEKNSD